MIKSRFYNEMTHYFVSLFFGLFLRSFVSYLKLRYNPVSLHSMCKDVFVVTGWHCTIIHEP